ncbi:TIGR01777 family oxidoreductase [Flavobacterium branchiophilum]|uniref:TIGR01777 family protein n=1 Tax=Flavobacterium branchiophilum TaxID=55197 RepID=A0A2H3KXL3_9FLAO|nr:TIGR01777 family oxidoreductase [Flavobacterium branchiophilum]PDS25816.1 TIGR01777 family protein [Flavobacterium branchiophilum]
MKNQFHKIVIAGGTGFLGKVLQKYCYESTTEIVILTRGQSTVDSKIKYVNWDAKTFSGWEKHLEGADVLINLTGKSVDCRYTEANKKIILNSRIDSTAILNQAVLQCLNPPKHWLNISTATIYRFSLDKQMDEYTGEIGSDFSMDVAKAWEQTFFGTTTPKTLKTALRTSIVLGHQGGALVPLKKITLMGFGGKQGPGNQLISWIHEQDFARAVAHIIQQKIIGPVNIVSPKPISNQDFMSKLRAHLNRPFGIAVSNRLLHFAAFLIQTEPELVLKSRNVIPKKLIKNGFQFEFDTLDLALKSLTSTKSCFK